MRTTDPVSTSPRRGGRQDGSQPGTSRTSTRTSNRASDRTAPGRTRTALAGLLALAALGTTASTALPGATAEPHAEPHVDGVSAVLPGPVGLVEEPTRSALRSAGDPADHAFLSSSTPPARWDPCDTIDYRLRLQGAPRDGEALVHTAVAAVAEATGLRFRYLGQTSFVPRRAADVEGGVDLSIAFAEPAETDLWNPASPPTGIAGMSWRRDAVTAHGVSTDRAYKGRAVLNSADFRSFEALVDKAVADRARAGAAFPTTYVRNLHLMARTVVMHEVAHATGLGHSDADGGQVMAPVSRADGRVTGWGAGDLAGLRRLGAEAGCLRTTEADAAAAERPAPVPAPAVPAWQPAVARALGTAAAAAPVLPSAAPAAAPTATTRTITPRAYVRGPATVRRAHLTTLTITGTPSTSYRLHVRQKGSTAFRVVRSGTLGSSGAVAIPVRLATDIRWYAELGNGARSGVALTQVR